MDDVVASVVDRAVPDRTVASVGTAGSPLTGGNEIVKVDDADGVAVYREIVDHVLVDTGQEFFDGFASVWLE